MGCVRDHIGNTLGCVKGLKSGYEILTKTSLLIQVLPNSSVALQRRWMPAGRHSRLLKYPLGKMELQKEAVPNVCCCFILVFLSPPLLQGALQRNPFSLLISPLQWKESSWFVVWHCCRWSWRSRCQEKERTEYLRWP